jgi:ABC-2 type transport system ATP-binding protein
VNADGPLLSFRDVSKRYGQRTVLDRLAFTFPPSVIGLVGPNGAGKSTLMKIILGFLPFDGGAEILGLNPRHQAPALRALIGYMPERDGLPTGMNAVDLCTLGARLAGLPDKTAMERAHASLGFVGLGDKRYQPTDGYSTGMKQRVRLALALTHGPRLLLLDEPTNGLDPAGRDEMLQLIADIPRRSGASVILSSHLLPDIESVCDQALVLDLGKLVFAGPLKKLKGEDDAKPRRWEVRVRHNAPALAQALAEIGWRVKTEGESLQVEGPSGASTRPIFDCAIALGLQVRHLQPARRGLEGALLEALAEGGVS